MYFCTIEPSICVGIVGELQAELRRLKSEVSALKTQQKLDQADLASATEPSFESGMNFIPIVHKLIFKLGQHSFGSALP